MDQRFIIFARKDTETTRQLQVAMSKAVRSSDLDWCSSLESFLKKFRAPHNYNAVILLIENEHRSDLKQLQKHQELFGDMRIFMVLPDSSDEIIYLAHMMYPRFITYTDSNFTEELTAIIRKMAVMNN